MKKGGDEAIKRYLSSELISEIRSEIVEGQVSEIAKGQVSELGKGQVSELAKGQVSELAKGQVSELAKGQILELGKGQVSELAKRQVSKLGSEQDQRIIEETERNGFGIIRAVRGGNRAVSVSAPAASLMDGRGVRLAVGAVSEELCSLIPPEILRSNAPVTVICLGNAAFTADSLGPLAGRDIIATRSFLRSGGSRFSDGIREVSALLPSVGGRTGIEASELARACMPTLKPGLVIAIDALRAVKRSSLCSVIQISEGGIIPGSGVGNARAELSERTLGAPVITIGSPTAISSGALICDALKRAGIDSLTPTLEEILRDERSFTVTESGADEAIALHARVIAGAINLALLGFDGI